jgi:hypothetical protein
MAIEYSIAVEGDTLLVDAWGFDESLTQVQEYGIALIAATAWLKQTLSGSEG